MASHEFDDDEDAKALSAITAEFPPWTVIDVDGYYIAILAGTPIYIHPLLYMIRRALTLDTFCELDAIRDQTPAPLLVRARSRLHRRIRYLMRARLPYPPAGSEERP
jgi:hypothetical protein